MDSHFTPIYNLNPHTEKRPFFTYCQIVEMCEWLYRDTGETRYKDLALKWAVVN